MACITHTENADSPFLLSFLPSLSPSPPSSNSGCLTPWGLGSDCHPQVILGWTATERSGNDSQVALTLAAKLPQRSALLLGRLRGTESHVVSTGAGTTQQPVSPPVCSRSQVGSVTKLASSLLRFHYFCNKSFLTELIKPYKKGKDLAKN